jgi:hypothetical protein
MRDGACPARRPNRAESLSGTDSLATRAATFKSVDYKAADFKGDKLTISGCPED